MLCLVNLCQERKSWGVDRQREASFITISWLILSEIVDNIGQEDEQWLGEESDLPGETGWRDPSVQTTTDQLSST